MNKLHYKLLVYLDYLKGDNEYLHTKLSACSGAGMYGFCWLEEKSYRSIT